MKVESTSFRTRKKHRVYKRSRLVGGSLVYAETFTLRVKQGGVTSYFKLGPDKKQAGNLADEIMAFLGVAGNSVSEALVRYSESHKGKAILEEKKPASKEVELTVADIIAAYESITRQLSRVTVKNNVSAIRHVAAGIMNLKKLGVNQTKKEREEWRAKVDPFPISGLTLQAVERFRQKEIQACGSDAKKRGAMFTTINSYIRSCRSIFADKLLPLYADLKLPTPLPFRGILALPEPPHRYQSKINVAELIEDAKRTLKPSSPAAWIVFLLCIGAGLRREEIDKLMWEEVDLKAGQIWIRTTEFFRPKAKNSEDYVDLSPSVTAYLKEFADASEDKRFVISGREVTGKLRCLPTFRILMRWLRERGVSVRTPLHTLRKEAGSMVFLAGGSIDKTAEFLRNDPRVAKEHYIGRKERNELILPGL